MSFPGAVSARASASCHTGPQRSSCTARASCRRSTAPSRSTAGSSGLNGSTESACDNPPMAPRDRSDAEPLAAAALAAAAGAAAHALAEVARASDKAALAAQAEVLRLRVAGTARVNALRYPRALVAKETTAALPEARRDWEVGLA